MKKRYYFLMFFIIFVITGIIYFVFFLNNNKSNVVDNVMQEMTTDDVVAEEYESVKIYTPDSTGKYLELHNRDIPKAVSLRQRVVMCYDALRKQNGSMIPKSAKLLNTFVDGETLYLNINGDIKNIPHEADKEMLAIYSIVDTMTDLANIKKVKFLVNGEETDSFGGELNTSNYFERDENLLSRGE